MRNERAAALVLRVGLAFAFLYPPISAVFEPDSWIGYFPQFLRWVPDPVLLHGFGLIEVAVALWLLSGKKIFVPSVVAAVMLAAIVVCNSGDFEILFRDLSIACMALALAVMSYPGKKVGEHSS